MKTIVLISCASKKLSRPAKARDIYASSLFKLNLKFAESLRPDKVFILSAKHGLLELEKVIEPYNTTLNNLGLKELKAWAETVLQQLAQAADLKNDKFVILAGEKYRKHLLPSMKNFEIPLEGLGIGKQLKFLKEKASNE